jgi:hypothetical protein
MIDDLKQYRQRKCGLVNMREKIQTLESEIRAMKGADTEKISVRGSAARVDDKLIDLIVERDQLKRNYIITDRNVKQVDRAMETLDEKEKKTLELFYIDRPHGHVNLVCELWGCEYAEAYRNKDDALKKLTVACYGIAEI